MNMFGLGIPIFNWRITSPINMVWKLPIDNTNIIHMVFRPLDEGLGTEALIPETTAVAMVA